MSHHLRERLRNTWGKKVVDLKRGLRPKIANSEFPLVGGIAFMPLEERGRAEKGSNFIGEPTVHWNFPATALPELPPLPLHRSRRRSRCRTLAGAAAGPSPEPPPESCRNHRWNLAGTAVEIAATAN
ncbi:hypothetical protein VNO80_06255 [Phaseolus coccineus]|uniref:Uncharacterized protein n=1 Tax=Phaseolus coccineus TaxID=3886 RepID=A0AAN9NHR6_PHACN